jgi:hypothetical protein
MKNKSPKRETPSRFQALLFSGKALSFQIKRTSENFLNRNLKRFSTDDKLKNNPVIAESKTPLWTENDPAERFLSAGKVHNLRLAIKKLNNLEIPAGEAFSFWKHVGKTSRRKGYTRGRELREGCLVPSIGGGLCQLSNALYDAALQAGFEILERHAHSQIVPGSLAEMGRDATVFWNYVDLRFKSPDAFRIEAFLDAENLVVRFRGEKTKSENRPPLQIAGASSNPSSRLGNCATCGVEECFRMIKPTAKLDFGSAAFLLDEFSPEFNEYIQSIRKEKDSLSIPLDGRRFKKANYAWTTVDFAAVNQSFLTTLYRSYKSRKLAAQGAERQKNLLAFSEKLAADYARNLKYDHLHLVIQQNLLPFLWRGGFLGGRSFDVLMTSLPIEKLQERLDFAASLHPESKTLNDFRAENELAETETEALRSARKIITPHTEIAALFPEKAELLNWKLPEPKISDSRKNGKPTIVFPASTVGRKGVYELREAIRGLDIKLLTMGALIENQNFWHGFDVEKGDAEWLAKADLVVLPAFVEHKPRRILEAAVNRIPVIASKACGVETVANIQIIETGNSVQLRTKIEEFLSQIEALKQN